MKKANNRKTLLKALCAVAIMLILFTANTAFAAGEDPVQMASDLVDIIFTIVRIIGVALLLFGVVQLGISLKNHDPSQRANAMMGLAGGILIVLAKEILAAIGIQL